MEVGEKLVQFGMDNNPPSIVFGHSSSDEITIGVAIAERSKSGAFSAFRRSEAWKKLDNTGDETTNGISLLEIESDVEPDVEDVGDAKLCKFELNCGEQDGIVCAPLCLSLIPIPTIFELSSFLALRSRGTIGSDSCIGE